jgi:hypothetical protein
MPKKTRRAGRKYQARRVKALLFAASATKRREISEEPQSSTSETTPWPFQLTPILVDPVRADLERIPDDDPRLAHYIVLRFRNP